MYPWLLFITAKSVPIKQLNKTFLLIRNYEHNGGDPDWVLLRDKELPKQESDVISTTYPVDIGDDTLTESNNVFVGWTPDEIYDFMMEKTEALDKLRMVTRNWIIIDDKGIETQTCLVCEDYQLDYEEQQEVEEGEKEEKEFPAYQMVRMRWVNTWSMYCNLDIANMGFDEWVDEEAGEQDDGAYKPAQWIEESDNKEPEKREEALKKAREGGIIDQI